jgi:hypothetical protein
VDKTALILLFWRKRLTDLYLCNPGSIPWTSTEFFGYFTPVGVHQLCEQKLHLALTDPILCIVFSWCRKQQLAALQISVNLEVLGQERSALFKRRKELGTHWGKEKRQNGGAKGETSIIWCHSVFGFCPSFCHTLSCQIVTLRDFMLRPRSRCEAPFSAVCYATSSGNFLPMFRINISVPFSGVEMVPILTLEEGTDRLSPKRRQGITTTRCVITQKSAVLFWVTCLLVCGC